ncbi:hypothetical protein [Spirosoma radiotolerans]|uniref:Lipoprotein n=1 Tax=Spirosoma radiotolerans TaxID=1379870 RepID=A0A0E4A0H8_9BACT|nr:hypothetical protein [Spirosoma radiotolerans]AKD57965.1 hypothetical protein SD10_26735 [Spirosoma radiotolerans]
MKKRLLFCSLLGMLTACQHEGDIQPNSTSLASEVVGTYRTNFYLDPSCVAISAGQMPYAELKAQSDSVVTLVYTRLSPVKTSRLIENVSLSRQANGVQLRLANANIGTLQTDRVFTDNGMEKQGKLLRIDVESDSQDFLTFAGVKQ